MSKNDDIIYYLSHEIRKPIANIVGVINIIQEDGFSVNQRIECKKNLDVLLGDLDRALSVMDQKYGSSIDLKTRPY